MPTELRINSKKKGLFLVYCLLLLIAFITGLMIYIYTAFIFVSVYAMVSILLGPPILYLAIKKLASNQPAIIISDNGIFENSSIISVGFIQWNDNLAVEKTVLFNQNAVVLVISNKMLSSFIARETDILKRLIMKANYQTCGTLVTIFENSIDVDFDAFADLVAEKVAQSKV
jgi:hypothetical protein